QVGARSTSVGRTGSACRGDDGEQCTNTGRRGLHGYQRGLRHTLGGERTRALDECLEVSSLWMRRQFVDDACTLTTARVAPIGVEALAVRADDAVEHVPEVGGRHLYGLGAGTEAGVGDGRSQLGRQVA